MMPNKSSSSTTGSITITETLRFNGKGVAVALLLLAMCALLIAAMAYKCTRGRRNDAKVDVQTGVQLAAP
ncbi:hypothetical protein REPUB_Repub20aG0121000 [Reevesia pubescens]